MTQCDVLLLVSSKEKVSDSLQIHNSSLTKTPPAEFPSPLTYCFHCFLCLKVGFGFVKYRGFFFLLFNDECRAQRCHQSL